ncbi:meiosis initiator protein [Equus quagga]|uniref:meiosis initiator protein n=1 Tax=Equus quagga TaxID=89248 RepID=UPI001EE19913|nr:meiosis initiator protein [Equus quagga]
MWDSSRHVCSPERPKAGSLSPGDRTLVPCSLVEGEVGVSLCEPHGRRVGDGWFPKGNCHQKRGDSKLLSPNRKQRKNHTSKLHELALLLPVALKAGTKKLTKKEILLHVLQYIQHLQRSIDMAKALLQLHTSDGEGGAAGLGQSPAAGPSRHRHSTPCSSPHSRKSRLRGACQKPQKKKLARASERQTQAQNPRRCLALDKPNEQVTSSPDQKGGNVAGTATPPRCPSSCSHPKPVSSPPRGDRKGGRSWLTLLDVAENSVQCDISSCYCKHGARDAGPDLAFEAQHGAERIHFLHRTQPLPRQQLVFYDSCEEVDKETLDADPWLPAWIPEGSPHGSPLALGPPQIGSWSVTGHLSEVLGLSPSLFSSPGKLLPEQILEDDAEYLSQVLFEEVFSDPTLSPSACALEAPQKDTPSEDPEEAPDSHSLCQSSVSLDHCYLSLSENSKVPSSPSSVAMDSEAAWVQLEDAQAQSLQSSSDEDGDYTWTPTRRASTLSPAGRKARKGRAGRGPVKPKEKKKALGAGQTKKKCVNGFIMFCRMNRKQYIRTCPGTASTAATKELARLWRVMTLRERRPYCIKARRFSRQHNRIVKQDSSSSEDDDWETPKPFYQLLAEKARRSPEPAPRSPPGTSER